jgi:hypothetical protein
MSSLTESASRAALLQMARAPLAYGRSLLSARAIVELACRAFNRRITNGCSVSRCVRFEQLIIGRRRQVMDLLADTGPIGSARPYKSVLEMLEHLQSKAQAATAVAAMDTVIHGDTNGC